MDVFHRLFLILAASTLLVVATLARADGYVAVYDQFSVRMPISARVVHPDVPIEYVADNIVAQLTRFVEQCADDDGTVRSTDRCVDTLDLVTSLLDGRSRITGIHTHMEMAR